MMRSALYYPHTEVKSIGLLKTSLLLWDWLEYIVPWEHYEPNYAKYPSCGKAMALIGERHYTSDQEKEQADEVMESLVHGGLPPSFYIGASDYAAVPKDERRSYEVWAGKLLEKTWDRLKHAGIAQQSSSSSDYQLTPSAGLTVMSVLADSCAGGPRRRVPDRPMAYATIAKLLSQDDPGAGPGAAAPAQLAGLVHSTLKIVDATAIPLQKLIAFRKNEAKEHGHFTRNLRRRYVERIESCMTVLTGFHGNESDEQV